MIPTKICGITNLDDANVAVENGASAIGFIFYEKSPRTISINNAKSISKHLPKTIARVGVFVNHEKDFIRLAISEVPLDMIQLHGDETPDFCNQFDVAILKALRIKNEASLSVMDQYDVAVFLLDTFSNDQYGGTGETFDWSVLNRKFKTPIILSGGLNSENILDAIDAVNPSAVDVNSGVESSPGKKDFNKLKSLFKNLNKTQSTGFQFG
ncbi:MAG: phosphoribosylanthranilate isomerase [Candidatus Neomarinimicrobiota bacterium]|jgi:phosphoribosylanthranilate isomerase|nr:phosphoribosylanthranilate isomerase [Candidatus Neomarinimicrobiota bacterium]HIA83994.1 phosphoribosylanthranilate isomerase [Candidatus Neomarinimicrobiota bacterium]